MIKQSILKTLHYFDITKFPLTKEEIFSWLWQCPNVSREQLEWELQILNEEKKIGEKYGYYFLYGGEDTVEWRRERLLSSEDKMKIALKAAKKINFIPFLRAIFVCNTVGSEQSTENSDIDFLIITHPKRIWTVRLLSNLILRLYRLRTFDKKIKNRICLSFYLDAHHLSLSNYRIVEDDIHFAYWLNQMIPVYDPDNIYAKFLQANSWSKKFLTNVDNHPIFVERLIINDSKIGKVFKKIWEKIWEGGFGNFVEKQSRLTQWLKMNAEIKNKINRGDKGIVISEGVIKLHERDMRAHYRQEWLKRINNIC